MRHQLALIGFGTVAQGFVEILLRKDQVLREDYGMEFTVVAITDPLKGSLYDPEGLDLSAVMNTMEATGSLTAYPDGPKTIRGWDSFTTIAQSGADTIIEATFTNVVDGQPGLDHCRAALRRAQNVVTTNKGPIALAYQELRALAEENAVRILFEGTVMSGTPVLRLAATALVGNEVRKIRGILNGTSNFILSKMDQGMTFDDALAEAQGLGYAEADPTADVDGYDAQYKLQILAHAVFGEAVERDRIVRHGIRAITAAEVAEARRQGRRYKLIAQLERTAAGLVGSVSPEALPIEDPLAGVLGAANAISFDCDLSGEVTMVGPGAGRLETGYALLVDCMNLVRENL